MKNQSNTSFWTKGQSFLFFAPESAWQSITDEAKAIYKASLFETIEVGSSGTLTIEESRFIQKESVKPPTQSAIRLCIVYNIDRTSAEAANALLKVIEEPAPQTRFVLFATTTRVLDTIRSRCVQKHIHQRKDTNDDILLPLEKDMDFATVSLRITGIVNEGNALALIDQWTRELLKNGNRIDAMHWLIEIRAVIAFLQSVNATALLEVTYLHITHQLPLPTDIEKYLYTHHGHI